MENNKKITLPVKDIKNFFEVSKYVKSEKNDVSPILRYLKIDIEFGICFITKANLDSFCKYNFSINHDDISFLIEEEKLSILVSLTKEDKIEIQYKKDHILLTDGYFKQKCNNISYKVTEFRSIPDFLKSESFVLNKSILSKLSSAKIFLGKDNIISPYFLFVYFEEDKIYSSSGQSIYFYKMKDGEKVPKFALTENECTLLSGYESVIYSKSENYNTYKIGNVVYGFIQSSNANYYPAESQTNKAEKKNYAIIKIEDIINFCNSTLKFSGNTYCNSDLFVESEISRFVFSDLDKGEENSIETKSTLIGEPFVFRFNPSIWLSIFQNMPYDNICIGNEQGVVSIWNDSDPQYIGLLSKLMR